MLTREIFDYVRSCVAFDDDGWCQYADDLADDVADLICDCTRALESGRDPIFGAAV